jgi:hypothetical protein
MFSAIRLVRPLLVAVVLLAGKATAQESDDTITVYKSPGCGCCETWAEHCRGTRSERTELHATVSPLSR